MIFVGVGGDSPIETLLRQGEYAAEPSEDATYTDYCDDTDLADPHNVMTQGKRGRSKDPSVIHLTAGQIARARGYLFGRWPNLVADTVAAATTA